MSERTCCSGLEISRPVDIGNQPGLFRSATPDVPASSRSRPSVDRSELREPSEVFDGFLGSLADDRHVQAAADDFRNFAEWQACLRDGVIPGTCSGTLLERQPVKVSGIEPVHRGPAIAPVAHIGRDALFAGDCDEDRNEAVIAVPVDRQWKTDYRRADAANHERGRRRFRRRGSVAGFGAGGGSFSVAVRPGARSASPVVTNRGRSEPSSAAERLDGASVDLAVLRELREVVDKGRVNDGIRLGRSAAQALEIFERTALDVGARRGKRLGTNPIGRGRPLDAPRRSTPARRRNR